MSHIFALNEPSFHDLRDPGVHTGLEPNDELWFYVDDRTINGSISAKFVRGGNALLMDNTTGSGRGCHVFVPCVYFALHNVTTPSAQGFISTLQTLLSNVSGFNTELDFGPKHGEFPPFAVLRFVEKAKR